MKYFFFVKKKKIIHDISLIKRAAVQKGPTHSEQTVFYMNFDRLGVTDYGSNTRQGLSRLLWFI